MEPSPSWTKPEDGLSRDGCLRLPFERYYGTEFTSKALDHWAYMNHVRLDFSRPGKPTDNPFIESFNAQLRRECLSQHYFLSLIDARVALETWREEYNNRRPHGSLGQRTPAEYRAEVEGAEAPEVLALSVPVRSSVG